MANSNLLIVAAFSNGPFFDKTSSPVKNSTLPDDKAENFTIFLSKSYWALFFSILLWTVLIFSQAVVYNRLFLNLKKSSDGKVVSCTKNENGSLVESF